MSDSILMYFNFNFSAMQNLHFSFAIENNKQLTKKFLNDKTSGFMHYLVVKPSLMDILLLDIAGTVVHSYLKKQFSVFAVRSNELNLTRKKTTQ